MVTRELSAEETMAGVALINDLSCFLTSPSRGEVDLTKLTDMESTLLLVASSLVTGTKEADRVREAVKFLSHTEEPIMVGDPIQAIKNAIRAHHIKVSG